MKRATAVLFVALAAATGCDETPASPTPRRAFTASIDRQRIPPGETATITFRYENLTGQAMTLTFPSSCFVRVTLTRIAPPPVISLSGGFCATVITTRTLAPGEVLTSVERVRGIGATGLGFGAASPGSYRAMGVVEATGMSDTADVEFTVE